MMLLRIVQWPPLFQGAPPYMINRFKLTIPRKGFKFPHREAYAKKACQENPPEHRGIKQHEPENFRDDNRLRNKYLPARELFLYSFLYIAGRSRGNRIFSALDDF